MHKVGNNRIGKPQNTNQNQLLPNKYEKLCSGLSMACSSNVIQTSSPQGVSAATQAVEKISYQAKGLPDGYSISAFVQTSLSRLNIEE